MAPLNLSYLSMALKAAALASLVFVGWHLKAAIDERAALRVEVAGLEAQLSNMEQAQVVTNFVLTSRVQSAAAIKTKAKDVQVEIEKRIPADSSCNLSPDWRLLHDAAASDDEVPTAPSGADAKTVTPKQAAITVTGNYEICRDNADRLDKLQQWVGGLSDGRDSVTP